MKLSTVLKLAGVAAVAYGVYTLMANSEYAEGNSPELPEVPALPSPEDVVATQSPE